MNSLLPVSNGKGHARAPTQRQGKMFLSIVCALLTIIVLLQISATQPLSLYSLSRQSKSPPVEAPLAASTEEKKVDGEYSMTIAQSRSTVGWSTMLWGGQEHNNNLTRSIKTQERYAARHGYPFFLLTENLFDLIWSKPAFLLSIILDERRKPREERLEWIVWTDADSMVLNPLLPVDRLLPPPDLDAHLIVTNDIFGLNAGAMMIRVSEYSVGLLTRMMAYPKFHPDEQLTAAEQSALEKLILGETEVQYKTLRMPQRWFNGYRPGMLEGQNTEPGNLMMHFPGGNKQYMGEWLDMVEGNNTARWSIPFEKTEYPKLLEKYWTEARQRKDRGAPLYVPATRQ